MGRLLDEDIVIDALIGISGSKSIEELTEECEVYQSDNRCYSGGVYGAIRAIKTLPSVQPERKKGEWLPDNNNAYEMRFVCSCCKESEVVPTIGFTKYRPLWDFCPNCGADMRGEQDG